ncbi:peptidoglycan-binding protein [Lewinella sp. 4G2]|uniref:peptidoglycan-binding domain-containing protein n=1 Tax=Lewinella sp. 4G2 TaxID=1803372 RepID=UPI0007B47D40|nr:hypothetical protein [Lewinella sp. 4G2]OAV43049.1 hypothetical protein A3850_000395 [Lewinella sp. 4G2]
MTPSLTSKATLFLFTLLACFPLKAQDIYAVHAGIFRDVRGQDFKIIGDLGYVYSLPASDKEVEVMVGQYTSKNKATGILQQLNDRGFQNARLVTIPSTAGTPEIMVQFALHGTDRPIKWKEYLKLGPLHASSLDGTLKVFTGPYPSTEAAKTAIKQIKAAGYADAFVKIVPSLQLIPIDVFETGVKQPLIPIVLPPRPAIADTADQNLSQPTTAPRAKVTNVGEDVSEDTGTVIPRAGNSAKTPNKEVTRDAPSPTPMGSTVVVPTNSNNAPSSTIRDEKEVLPASEAVPPTSTALVKPPNLDGSTKRHSTAELQTILTQRGFYTSGIDGLYGPGTQQAYERAVRELPALVLYKQYASHSPRSLVTGDIPATSWPETQLLLTVADELAAGTTDQKRAKFLKQQRKALYTTKTTLSAVASSRTKDWAASLWENLNDWASEDPFHSHVITALKVSYHQTQSRLEQHYSDAGFTDVEARDLAIAMMQNLVGAELNRFL